MGIIEEYLNTSVHRDTQAPITVNNPMEIDFNFEWNTSESDQAGNPIPAQIFTIPANSSLTLPKGIAMEAVLKLARTIEYSKCQDKSKWKGSARGVWLPIAESLVAKKIDPVTKKPSVKTEADKIKETIEKLNSVDEQIEENLSDMSFSDLRVLAKEKGVKTSQRKREDIEEEIKSL